MIALLAALALSQSAFLDDEAVLRTHLCTDAASPLDALTPGGRRRFLASLAYGERGLGGFSFAPLSAELTEAEGRAVLVLFGAAAYADGMTFEGAGTTRTTDRKAPPAAYCEGTLTRDEWLAPTDPGPVEEAAIALEAALTAADDLASDAEGRRDVTPERRAAFAAYGSATLSLEALNAAPTWPVRDLLSSTLRYVRHTDDPAGLEAAAALLAMLEARGEATKADVRSVHDAYLAAFDDAGAADLRSRYPGADLAPRPDGMKDRAFDQARTVYVATGSDQVRSAVVPDDFTGVIVVARPGCGFSDRMLSAVMDEAGLTDAMTGGGMLVLPPNDDGTGQGVASWNAANSPLPYHAVRTRADWPEVGVWATPSFYRYEDGVVVDSMIGWPRDEESARLRWLQAALVGAR